MGRVGTGSAGIMAAYTNSGIVFVRGTSAGAVQCGIGPTSIAGEARGFITACAATIITWITVLAVLWIKVVHRQAIASIGGVVHDFPP